MTKKPPPACEICGQHGVRGLTLSTGLRLPGCKRRRCARCGLLCCQACLRSGLPLKLCPRCAVELDLAPDGAARRPADRFHDVAVFVDGVLVFARRFPRHFNGRSHRTGRAGRPPEDTDTQYHGGGYVD